MRRSLWWEAGMWRAQTRGGRSERVRFWTPRLRDALSWLRRSR